MKKRDVEIQFGLALTANQWRIIQQELADKDPDESIEEVLADVCRNLESYESEYEMWEGRGKPY